VVVEALVLVVEASAWEVVVEWVMAELVLVALVSEAPVAAHNL